MSRKAPCIALAAALASYALPAAANGINPPPLKAQVVISAICTTGEPGAPIELYRVKVAPGADAGALVMKAPGTDARPVSLTDLDRLTLTETTLDREGFAAARVRMRTDTQEQELRIALAQAGEPVKLTGFFATGKAAIVVLASCRELVFPAPGSTEPPAKPTVKN